jgi:hypothetical protein
MVLRGLPRTFFDLVLYQVGWCLCIFGTADGRQWAGAFYAVFATIAHLSIVPRPGVTFIALALVGLLGFALDGLLTYTGLLVFEDQELLLGWLPPWMLGLWVMFAFLLDSALRWLHGRYLLAALVGAVGGPAAYLGGQSIGALQMAGWTATLAVAAVWAVSLPIAVRLFEVLAPGRTPTLAPDPVV